MCIRDSFYVWLDAPIGYIASIDNWANSNNKSINDYWSSDSEYEIIHFIGKDIAYFHGLFWPATLDSANFKLPDSIFVHGFLTVNGEKMSKSKGTGIKTDTFAKHCDPEMLRYYFAAKLNDKVEDIDLNLEDFTQRINSDLVGKYLNILSRSSTFIQKNKGLLSNDIDEQLINTVLDNAKQIQEYFEVRQYSKAIRLIMDMADLTNKYINDKTPWKLENEEATFVATTAINAFRILSIYLNPVLPKLTEAAFKSLGIETQTYKSLKDKLISSKLEKYTPLLTRMELSLIHI